MPGTLLVRRMATADRLLLTPQSGEFLADTALERLFLGDGLQAGGNLVDGAPRNTQTGTSYAVLATDVGKIITFSNGSAVAVSIAQAGSSGGSFFGVQSGVWVLNLGTGTVTITPATSTINSSATLALAQYEGARVFSDGSNYFAIIGRVGGAGSTLASLTDVNLTSPILNDLLSFDGTDWINKKPLVLSTKTANYGVLAAENGTHFNNIGAGGAVYFTLPTAAAGLFFGFLVHATQTVRVVANTSDFIAIGGTNSASAGYLESNAPFSFVSVEAHDAVQWIASSSVGSWSVN